MTCIPPNKLKQLISQCAQLVPDQKLPIIFRDTLIGM